MPGSSGTNGRHLAPPSAEAGRFYKGVWFPRLFGCLLAEGQHLQLALCVLCCWFCLLHEFLIYSFHYFSLLCVTSTILWLTCGSFVILILLVNTLSPFKSKGPCFVNFLLCYTISVLYFWDQRGNGIIVLCFIFKWLQQSTL